MTDEEQKKIDMYDEATGHYKCPDCGFWSTHSLKNHNCFVIPQKKVEKENE